MTHVIVLSRHQAERMPLDGESVVMISITDPYTFRPDLPTGLVDVLSLQFYDVDRLEGHLYYPMNEEQAKKIASFVNKYWGKVSFMIVHCEAGISRSSGVAGAILKAKTGDDSLVFNNPVFSPNMLCYRLTLNALVD